MMTPFELLYRTHKEPTLVPGMDRQRPDETEAQVHQNFSFLGNFQAAQNPQEPFTVRKTHYISQIHDRHTHALKRTVFIDTQKT